MVCAVSLLDGKACHLERWLLALAAGLVDYHPRMPLLPRKNHANPKSNIFCEFHSFHVTKFIHAAIH